MCTDGQPRTSYTHGHTRTTRDVLRVLADTHGRPVQPTWAKITRTIRGKGQRADSKDQRADMYTDGQPRTSYTPRGPESPKQSTGRAGMLSPRTNVLICVLTDTHGRPVCADGHTRAATDVLCVLADTHRRPVQPTWAKITRTVHRKGQRAESKYQRGYMCTDGQPRTSCVHGRPVCADGHTRTATDVLCVLMDTHGRPMCADGRPPGTSCMCWWTTTDVLCVLNRQPTWAKITRTIRGKGQRADSKDQRADMYTMDSHGHPVCSDGHTRTATDVLCVLADTHRRSVCTEQTAHVGQNHPNTRDVLHVLADTHGRPVCTEQTAHVGQNHPNNPREGSAC
ncbi:unnamed protein product [Brassica rapa]|uniref:Uncharacterized protein n=1 Tax=Brassica campestris TaxID=3711 RepID=A0A8D9DFC0_BRACM|nr:unnamed protein product [Brassica rapa]